MSWQLSWGLKNSGVCSATDFCKSVPGKYPAYTEGDPNYRKPGTNGYEYQCKSNNDSWTKETAWIYDVGKNEEKTICTDVCANIGNLFHITQVKASVSGKTLTCTYTELNPRNNPHLR